MNANELAKLFVLNDTKFTKQIIKGSEIEFVELKEKLTIPHLQKHLAGEMVLGVYPVLDGKTKWFCIDVDVKKEVYSKPDFDREAYIKQATEIVESIKTRLSIAGIKAYREDTGGKGAHLWLFFEPNILVKHVLRTIIPLLKTITYDKEIFHIEWFPNSENSKSVKLPEGVNLRYSLWSKLEAPFNKIEMIPPKALFRISNPMESVFTRCAAFRALKEKADVEKHLNNTERVAIASMVWEKGEDAIEFVKNYYFVGLIRYTPEVTDQKLQHFSKRFHPVTCAKMQQDGICLKQCEEIGNAKSPIEFYWEEVRNSNENSETKIIVDPMDKLIQRGSSFYEIKDNGQLHRISNFVMEVLSQEEITSENTNSINGVLNGKLRTEKGEEFPFSISLEDYTKNEKLVTLIYKTLRVGDVNINPKKMDLLRMCIDKYSKPQIIRKTRDFGFNSEGTVYYSPSVRIDRDSILPNNDLIVEITSNTVSGQLEKKLDLALDFSGRGEQYWKDYITKELPKIYKNSSLIIGIFAHVFEIFVRRSFGVIENNSPYILWYSGTSGVGKSSLMFIAQRLFGKFDKTYSFTATPYRVEYSGYFFKDAVFVVDDYKQANMSNTARSEYLQMMQNYADKVGRTRLTKDIEARESYFVRGNFMGNGEDIIIQEGSNIARMIMIAFTPGDVNIDSEQFAKLKDESFNINEFTPHIIKYCLNLDSERIKALRKHISDKLLAITDGYSNAPRITSNFSKYITAGFLAIDYLYGDDLKIKEAFYEFVVKALKEQLHIISEENPVGRFWNTLMEMLSTNQARVNTSSEVPDPNDKRPIVGFMKDGAIYIIHNLAYQLVAKFLERTTPLHISDKKLAQNLFESGFYDSRISYRVFFNGKQVRVYRVTQDKFLPNLELKDI